MPTAADIMTQAGRLLQDEEAVRWTLPELAAWINEAVATIALVKPSAVATTVELSLVSGTLQELATGQLSLLRITRNVGGRAVWATTRMWLDAQVPDWHTNDFSSIVRQYVYEEEDPRHFYVFPGNTGSGKLEAVVSKLPAKIEASGDADSLSSYAQDVGLPDSYLAPLTDYTVYRALSKDDPAASPAGAVKYYQTFATAMGIKSQVDKATSPNARAR